MHSHFQHIKINQDQKQAIEKINDFLESDTSIFILQGYAGTGKTTLIKRIVKYLEENKKILLRTHTSPVQIRTMLNNNQQKSL